MTGLGPSARIDGIMTTSNTSRHIVLMTDFGTQDTYVGVMKGVIASIAPANPILDLTHAIPQGDLLQTAYKLWQSVSYFPPETIFVIVVDPGVGTKRRAIGVKWQDYYLIAPDNGLLSFLAALEPFQAVHELTNPAYHHQPVSTTFHGRDVFAPAGAHLAAGADLADFGKAVEDITQLELPPLTQPEPNILTGEVIHIDGFGNAITSIGRLRTQAQGLSLEPWLKQLPMTDLPPADHVDLPTGMTLPLSPTFGAVPLGDPVAYLGSEQLLELAINGGSAADKLNLEIGAPITLRFRG